MEDTKHALFVGGLQETTLQEAVMAYFSKFGEILDANLIIDWVTNKSKCCAIVVCKAKPTKSKILRKRRHKIEGKQVRVSVADSNRKGTKIIKTKKVYIGNLSPKITKQQLRFHFQVYGQIQNLVIIHNCFQAQKQSTYAIIEYSSEEEAKHVLDQRDEHFIENMKLTCSPLKANKESHLAKIYQKLSHVDSKLLNLLIQQFFKKDDSEKGGLKFNKKSIESFIKYVNINIQPQENQVYYQQQNMGVNPMIGNFRQNCSFFKPGYSNYYSQYGYQSFVQGAPSQEKYLNQGFEQEKTRKMVSTGYSGPKPENNRYFNAFNMFLGSKTTPETTQKSLKKEKTAEELAEVKWLKNLCCPTLQL